MSGLLERRERCEGQGRRCAAALAAVALLMAVVPAVQGVADAAGAAAVPGARDSPSGAGGGQAGDARSLLSGLVFGSEGAQGAAGEVPAWLASAVPSVRIAREVVSDADLGLVGFVFGGGAREVSARLACELRDAGWEALAGGAGCQASFRRGTLAQDGDPSWASVTCVQIGDEVSVVVCYR